MPNLGILSPSKFERKNKLDVTNYREKILIRNLIKWMG